ncbi:MAG: zinc-binding dehydrogenase, partial [Actinomycetes bacterium]
GLCGIGACNAFGASKIFAVEVSATRLQMVKKFAPKAILLNPTEVDVVKKIQEATEGRGVDVALEIAGNAKATQTAKATTAKAAAAASKVASTAPTNAKDATAKAKDATYTVVGLGVLGLNKVQAQIQGLLKAVRSDDLAGRIKTQASDVAKATTDTVAKADERFEAVITKVEERFEPLEEKLPAQARDLSRKAREAGRSVRSQVRSKVLSD